MTTLVQPQYVQAWLDPGPIAGADRAYLFSPRLGVVGGPAVIWCHGALNSVTQVLESAAYEFVTRLCALGVTVVAPDYGDHGSSSGPGSLNSWGCPTATARIEAWRAWMVGNLACDASKITIMGFSMGGCTSLGYARDYPSKVNAVVNWCPAYDLVYMRANRADPIGAFASLIDDAYAINSTDPLPDGMDPYTNTALTDIKWRGYYRNDGAVYVPPDWVTRMATWTGGEAIPVYGVASHSTDTMAEPYTPFDELAGWCGFLG